MNLQKIKEILNKAEHEEQSGKISHNTAVLMKMALQNAKRSVFYEKEDVDDINDYVYVSYDSRRGFSGRKCLKYNSVMVGGGFCKECEFFGHQNYLRSSVLCCADEYKNL